MDTQGTQGICGIALLPWEVNYVESVDIGGASKSMSRIHTHDPGASRPKTRCQPNDRGRDLAGLGESQPSWRVQGFGLVGQF